MAAPIYVSAAALLLGACATLHEPEPPTVERRGAVIADELRPLYPDLPFEPAGPTELSVHTPRGTIAAAHVLVHGAPVGAELEFTLTDERGGPVAARWFRLVDVPVEENTGLKSRTERFDGDTNPHVIRRAPFRVFDPLAPVAAPLVVNHTDTIALRVELDIPADAGTGTRSLSISVAVSEWNQSLTWELAVRNAVVPPIGPDTFRYTNWFSMNQLARWYDAPLWSDRFWATLSRYAELMAHGRQNTFLLQWNKFFTRGPDGTLQLDRPRLTRFVDIFTSAGLHFIEGGHLAHRPGGDWSSPHLQMNGTEHPVSSPEGRTAVATVTAQLQDTIAAEGWEGRWLQHLSDEPTDTNAGEYQELARQVRTHMPGVRIVEATMSRELVTAVDVWCPQVQAFQQHRAFFEERQEAGDDVWVYTCLVPGGPWLNRLLDQERLRQVYVGWGAAKYGVQGFLHWGFDQYIADPYQQSVVDHPAQPRTKNRLPAGDTHVVYPGHDGPWSSQRFESHRIGIEDYELLRQLRVKAPDQCRKTIALAFRAFDDYATEITRYRAARRALLDALDRR